MKKEKELFEDLPKWLMLAMTKEMLTSLHRKFKKEHVISFLWQFSRDYVILMSDVVDNGDTKEKINNEVKVLRDPDGNIV